MRLLEAISQARVYPHNLLFLDYLNGTEAAAGLFSQRLAEDYQPPAPRANGAAVSARLRQILANYNTRLGADRAVTDSIAALANPDSLCVTTGQQAGLLGGPAYTLYKIATAISQARILARRTSRAVVPVFWLASEDHDFHEVNNATVITSSGEPYTVSFPWSGEGRSISDLVVSAQVTACVREWLDLSGTGVAAGSDWLPDEGVLFSEWVAGLMAKLFAGTGLVIVEPHLVRSVAADFFAKAVRLTDRIHSALTDAAGDMSARGYDAGLDPNRYGNLFTYDRSGNRVRVLPSAAAKLSVAQLSPDAALRPVLADSLFPTALTVLGPGEISYHAMLRGVYESFAVQQPVVYPRMSVTVLTGEDLDVAGTFDIPVSQVVTGVATVPRLFAAAIPGDRRQSFQDARYRLMIELEPLRGMVAEIDPSLLRSWDRAAAHIRLTVERLEDKAMRALLSRTGHSRARLQRLRNRLRPRNKPQERVVPAAHFMDQPDASFAHRLISAAEQYHGPRFDHLILSIR